MSADQTKEDKSPVAPKEEPKSAHATPVVEKYVEKRKDKAEEQIENEKEES